MRSVFCNSIAAIGLLLAGIGSPAYAQVATDENERHEFVAAVQLRGEQQTANRNDVIFTVPASRGFRVTDLIASNWGIGSCAVYLPGKTNEMIVPVDETISINFLSGPTYLAGQPVNLANNDRLSGHGPGCMLVYTVMGYLYKMKTTAP